MDGAPKKGNLRDRHSPPSFSAYFRFDNELRTFKNSGLRAADIIPELYTSNNARKTIYISYVGRALTNEVCCLSVSLPHHSPVSCSTPPLACLLLSFITRLTSLFPPPSVACLSCMSLPHHSPSSSTLPSLAYLSLYPIIRLPHHSPVSLALPHHSRVSPAFPISCVSLLLSPIIRLCLALPHHSPASPPSFACLLLYPTTPPSFACSPPSLCGTQCGTHIRTLQQGTHKINGRVAYLPCTCVKDVPHIDNLPEQPSSSSLAWICLFNSQYSALKDFSSLRPSSPSNLKLHLKKVISFLRVLRNASTLVSAKMKQTG